MVKAKILTGMILLTIHILLIITITVVVINNHTSNSQYNNDYEEKQ